jgi:predicted metal-dependent enzyme (double-stranded beta helix superfamily)
MTTVPQSPGVETLIRGLDAAVSLRDDATVCERVKHVLQDTIGSGSDVLAQDILRVDPAKYARRLLHRDPEGRYSVVVMVWGPGQGTDLHDHAGRWCVECVYQGKINVTSYELITPPGAEEIDFRVAEVVEAGPGEAGALIPPFEYHRIENPTSETAVTVHVYAAELTACHVFEPVNGGYRQELRHLSYTD